MIVLPIFYPLTGAKEYRPGEKWRHSKIWVWLFLMLLGAGIFFEGINEDMHKRRYATEGVRVEAEVLGTWMEGDWALVKYSFSEAGGRVRTREGKMWPGAEWEKAMASKKVEVVYLPTEPRWNQLVAGSDPEAIFGGQTKWWGAVCLMIFGSMFVAACWDYDVVSRLSVMEVRHKGRLLYRWPPE